MAIKIGISFKETEKELYDFLQKQLSPSIYVKELIQREIEATETKTESKTTRKGSSPFVI